MGLVVEISVCSVFWASCLQTTLASRGVFRTSRAFVDFVSCDLRHLRYVRLGYQEYLCGAVRSYRYV